MGVVEACKTHPNVTMSRVFIFDVVWMEQLAQFVLAQAVEALLLEQGVSQLVCLMICHNELYADLLIINYYSAENLSHT